MNRNLLKNLILILLPILVIVGAGIGLVSTGIISTESLRIDTEIINTTLIIDYGDNQIENYNIKIPNATVYSVLMHASIEYDFQVKATYYNNYRSHYINSIKNVNEGENNKFWQYYLNGNYGTVGADLQPLKNNDVVEWKFQEPKI